MKVLPRLVGVSLIACFGFAPSRAAETLPPHPDAVVQPGVPKGEQLKFELSGSKIFPGTTRQITVYVPKQYDPAKPACVYVNQDGMQWNVPVVFDNLIARGEIPVTIAVVVPPGVVKAQNGQVALDRFNRSYEYDGLGDAFARFLLEEVLPAVETKTTADGRPLRLSKSGNDRAIGGSSSGAICAFTAAWERPDAFTRVFSNVGTFVGLRGGDRYPILIRKYEPKPLRVFLVDGSNDNNIYGGDWWMANQTAPSCFPVTKSTIAGVRAATEIAGNDVVVAHNGNAGWDARAQAALLPSPRAGHDRSKQRGWDEGRSGWAALGRDRAGHSDL